MQKYDVLVSFTDSEDKAAPKGANVYHAGKSLYPRDGLEPSAERIAALKGYKNRLKKPVIARQPTAPPTEQKSGKE